MADANGTPDDQIRTAAQLMRRMQPMTILFGKVLSPSDPAGAMDASKTVSQATPTSDGQLTATRIGDSRLGPITHSGDTMGQWLTLGAGSRSDATKAALTDAAFQKSARGTKRSRAVAESQLSSASIDTTSSARIQLPHSPLRADMAILKRAEQLQRSLIGDFKGSSVPLSQLRSKHAQLLQESLQALDKKGRARVKDPVIFDAELYLIAQLETSTVQQELQSKQMLQHGTWKAPSPGSRYPVPNPGYPPAEWGKANANVYNRERTNRLREVNEQLHGKMVNGVRQNDLV